MQEPKRYGSDLLFDSREWVLTLKAIAGKQYIYGVNKNKLRKKYRSIFNWESCHLKMKAVYNYGNSAKIASLYLFSTYN